MESCAALRNVTLGVEKCRWCIIVSWAVLLVAGGVGAAFFIPACVLSFDPEKGMDSYDAEHHFKATFPNEAASTQWIALLEVPSPGQVLNEGNFSAFSSALLETLNETGLLVSYTSVSELNRISPGMGSSLVSESGNATMVQWVTREPFAQHSNLDFSKKAQHYLTSTKDQYLPSVPFANVISLSSFATGAVADSEKSLGEMDAISIPLAFLIFYTIVKSGRLLVLPLCGMTCCLAVSFGIMYLVAQVEEVQQTTPSLMMSILIAMSIDYSLFIMTRFKEELGKVVQSESSPSAAVREALLNTMETAGFTVLLSCLTLMVSFIALIFAPITIIASLGQGCAIALLISLSVHLTLLPAVVLCFPAFFHKTLSPADKGASRPNVFSKCMRRDRAESNVTRHGVNDEALNVEQNEPAVAVEETQPAKHPACFAWVARVTTTYPYNIIIVMVILGATLAVGYPILSLKTTASFVLTVPRGTEASHGVERLMDAFGIGYMTPYQLMFENPKGSVLEEPFWSQTQNILQELSSSLPDTKAADFTFPSFVAGNKLPFEVVKQCWEVPSEQQPCPQVEYLLKQFMNTDASAMYGLITLRWDPLDPAGNDWLKDARRMVAELQSETGVVLTLSGEAADTWDIVNAVYGFFPVVIAITLSVALVMLGLAFKSVVIPLRSVASIGLTLMWVYGFATLVYQHGILEWTGLPGLTGKYHAHQWFVPAISFSVVCGICLDYDIFLLSKTTELREMGMDAVEATREALCTTGRIITAAGIIMAIAFLGLMFASMLVINELSVFLVFAVLYDTFIVRSLLSPALMSLLGRYAWYPSKLSKLP